MRETDIAALSARFAEKLREAHEFLRGEMRKLRLLECDGWRIAESIRECEGGSEVVLRPIHFRLDAPEGLECVVTFTDEPLHVGAECAPAAASRRR